MEFTPVIETNQSTSLRPAVTSHNGQLICAFKEATSNKIDVIISPDGNTWDDLIHTNQSTDCAPSICSHQGALYIAFKESSSTRLDIIRSTDGGRTWCDLIHTNQGTDKAPSICSFDEKLYIAFKEATSTKIDVIGSIDQGVSWNGLGGLIHTNQGTDEAPSICASNGSLVIAFKEATSTKIDVISSDDKGKSWNEIGLVNTHQASEYGPTICSLESRLYIAFKEVTSEKIDVVYSDELKTWNKLIHTGQTSNIGPAITSMGINFIVMFQSEDSSDRLLGTIGSYAGNWMSDTIDDIGNKKLKDICIVGSHDAGMSVVNRSTLFGNACNTQTQRVGILEQLMFGARYFDIRPVIGRGEYYTGHYSNIKIHDKLETGQGAMGQSIAEIISDINTFTKNHNELIILNLSHTFDTNYPTHNAGGYKPFTKEQWHDLFDQLKKLDHLWKKEFNGLNLLETTINEYIGSSSCVLVLVELKDEYGKDVAHKIIGQGYNGYGFFPQKLCFDVFNKYSGTNDLNTMINNQVDLLKRNKGLGKYFLLSWTLTQSNSQAMGCALRMPGSTSILDLAQEANSAFYGNNTLMSSLSNNCFPNIIYVDDINPFSQFVWTAEYINHMFFSEI